MREHRRCVRMKKPLPFALGGQERFLRLLLRSRSFPEELY